MTVKELIKLLKAYPEDMPVATDCHCDTDSEVVNFEIFNSSEWYRAVYDNKDFLIIEIYPK